MSYVSVDADLSEFDTDELIEELKSRHEHVEESANIEAIIEALDELHVPTEILALLTKWANGRATIADLDRWRAAIND